MRTTLPATAVAALVLLLLTGCERRPGITIEVHNAGDVAAHSVWVYVTGDSAAIAELLPGHGQQLELRPTAESHVELSHTGIHPERLRGDTYFEPGYTGPVVIHFDADSAWVVRHADVY
jgi:hypothetical protein